MTIDTLSIAKDLKAAELPPAQAEAISAAIGRSISEGSGTRSDLLPVKQELLADSAVLRSDLQAVRGDVRELESRFDAKLDAEIEGLRATLTLWFIGTGLTLAAVTIAAVKL